MTRDSTSSFWRGLSIVWLLTAIAMEALAAEYEISLPFEQYEPDHMVNVKVEFPRRYDAKDLAFRLFGPGIAPAGNPIECDFDPYYIDSGIGPAVAAPRSPGQYEIRLNKGRKSLASAGFTVIPPSAPPDTEPSAAAAPTRAMPTVAEAPDFTSIRDSTMRLSAYRDHILVRLKDMDALYYEPADARSTLARLSGEPDGIAANSHYHFMRWDWGQQMREFYEQHATALANSMAIAKQRGGVDLKWLATVDSGMTCWNNHERTVEREFARYAEMWASKKEHAGDDWGRLQADFKLSELGRVRCFEAMPDQPPVLAPTAMAKLRFVIPVDGRYVALPDGVVHHGDEFQLQAEFDLPQKACGQIVDLDLGSGKNEQIPLVLAEDDPRICRSPVLRAENPDG